MLPGDDGRNINGPSVIRVPDWVEGRLGRYYLYFAHHKGRYIRLAYADRLDGPWTIYAPGALHLDDLDCCGDHIASPDVQVDEARRQIRLYFHGREPGGKRQFTYLATSEDGLAFSHARGPLAAFYLRVVPWRGRWLGMSKGGMMYLSVDGLDGFTRLPRPAFPMRSPIGNAPGDVRHVALHCRDDRLLVFFTRIGDAPEHVRMGEIDLARPPSSWSVDNDVEILRPEAIWEGADLPAQPSRAGISWERENALRDPAIYVEDDNAWLFYSYAGEQGIAMTEISLPRARASQLLADDLRGLQKTGALQARLDQMDKETPRNRLYLMGCGRSGTWLLTGLMHSYADMAVVAKELSVEHFGVLQSNSPNILLKRAWNSHETVEKIPEKIGIIHIIRHPYAVLTSHNPVIPREYYITSGRWLGEMMALKYLLDIKRPNLTVVRYEDLVTDPAAMQQFVAQACGLRIIAAPDEALQRLQRVPEAVKAMHGLRNIDKGSLDKFRTDPRKVAYLRSLQPRLEPLLSWMGQRFDYDLTL